jgi:electron transport complex protein RnfB
MAGDEARARAGSAGRADRADGDPVDIDELTARIDAALPQTQCRRCGYPSCRDYASAVAEGATGINRCPPGGAEGIDRLASLTHRLPQPLDVSCGTEGPRRVAWIVESHCIGCTLCIAACPVDCIVGAPKRMHTVMEPECTGCELCVPACPVDCILLEVVTPGRSGWRAWTAQQARESKMRFDARTARLARLARQNDERLVAKARHKLDDIAAASRLDDPALLARKRELVEAAVRRAQARLVAVPAKASVSPPPAGKIEP